MSPSTYETAAEFCKLVGTPNLLEYLGLPPDCSAAEARAKLKKRRKYMQGMQSNPKYRKEALFLIKHFGDINEMLGDPAAYLADARHRSESDHIPVLEMTIRGVLAGGSLSAEQEDYLERNATELGVSADTFRELMDRLLSEAGVERPTREDAKRNSFEEMFPDPEEITDFYRVLGVDPMATRDQIFLAYADQKQHATEMPSGPESKEQLSRVEKAWKVLGDDEIREQYNLARRRTGPPARNRDERDGPSNPPRAAQAETAPPVRPRSPDGVPRPTTDEAPVAPSARPTIPGDGLPTPLRAARLEILGDPVRTVKVGTKTVVSEVQVRNGGEQPMPGRISTDVPWLLAQPSRLDPNARQQAISVRINPVDLPDRHDTGVVTIQTDRGDRASVVFEVVRKRDLTPIIAVVGLCLVAIVAAFGLAWAYVQYSTQVVTGPTSLTVNVDPVAQEIIVNGISHGSGSSAYIGEPPPGEAVVEVKHPNFKPFTTTIQVEAGTNKVVNAELELAGELDFKPTPDMDKATVEQAAAQRVMTPRSRAMDACVRKGMRGNKPMKGTIRVHIGKDGAATGWEIDGKGQKNAVVRRCVERQAAAVIFPRLKDGDFATVRYEYNVR